MLGLFPDGIGPSAVAVGVESGEAVAVELGKWDPPVWRSGSERVSLHPDHSQDRASRSGSAPLPLRLGEGDTAPWPLAGPGVEVGLGVGDATPCPCAGFDVEVGLPGTVGLHPVHLAPHDPDRLRLALLWRSDVAS